MNRLDAALPPIWSRANPVDIAGAADAARYAFALEHLLDDGANAAVVGWSVPPACASPHDAAQSVVASAQRHGERSPKPVFAVWVGGGESASEGFDGRGGPRSRTETE